MRSRTIDRARPCSRAAIVGVLGSVVLTLCLAGQALAQGQPAAAPAATIEGPTPDLQTPTDLGLSIARDGTGGTAYLKQAGGVAHVFVSRLVGGSFQQPIQVDLGLAGASSQPVIAASNGGLLLVAFINDGQLFVADHLAGSGAFDAPKPLAGGALNPAISTTNFGKAYLAFAVTDGSGTDVRTAFFWQGKWALEPSPLNVTPGDDAGTGLGRPAVSAAGDGIAIAAWGEAGGVYTRRVWGTSPSTVEEQADGVLPGCTETSADEPVVGSGGDSSFANVAFHEQLSCGGQSSSRVLMNRLRGSAYDGLTQPDGLSGGGDGADHPQIAIGEYGSGVVTSERTGSHAVVATDLGDNGVLGSTGQVNSMAQSTVPLASPAMAGLYTRVVAWQQDPGASGAPEIRARYAPGRDPLGPEVLLSSPAQGPADASAGLAAGGDAYGDAAVVWVQHGSGSDQIMAAQLYQPPGSFSLIAGQPYVRNPRPALSWSAPREPWGPIHFELTIDGGQPTETDATSARPARPLSDGPHTYQVTASNPAGQQSQTGTGSVFVDTTPPIAAVTLRSTARIGTPVHALLSYRDLPPTGSPAGDASGVATARLEWGDGTVVRLRPGVHRATHVYQRPGRYTLTIVVSDQAGNVTRVRGHIKITKPKPRPHGPPHRHH